jgi:hypothetical protein
MPEEVIAGATITTEASAASATLLDKSDQPKVSQGDSILDTAGSAEKEAQEANNKRLIEADPTTLGQDDLAKRTELVKEQEAKKVKEFEEMKLKGVPEKYEIKTADGKIVDTSSMTDILEAFKKSGLTNQQAQAMVDTYAGEVKKIAQKADTDFKSFLETSAKETMEALGSNAKTELAYVAKVKGLLSKETLDVLNSSGIGNIKSFIFDLAKIGRMFSEEKNVDTGRGSAGGKSPAEVLYPSMAKE